MYMNKLSVSVSDLCYNYIRITSVYVYVCVCVCVCVCLCVSVSVSVSVSAFVSVFMHQCIHPQDIRIYIYSCQNDYSTYLKHK